MKEQHAVRVQEKVIPRQKEERVPALADCSVFRLAIDLTMPVAVRFAEVQ